MSPWQSPAGAGPGGKAVEGAALIEENVNTKHSHAAVKTQDKEKEGLKDWQKKQKVYQEQSGSLSQS